MLDHRRTGEIRTDNAAPLGKRRRLASFAGSLLELALACDRSYMLILPDDAAKTPKIAVSEANFALYPMATGQGRLGRRFYDEEAPLAAVRAAIGQALDADAALQAGPGHQQPRRHRLGRRGAHRRRRARVDERPTR